jgi:hypothetical protein
LATWDLKPKKKFSWFLGTKSKTSWFLEFIRCAQAGVHHDNVKTPVARVQNEKAATEAELQQ